jgi:hypothetical protein
MNVKTGGIARPNLTGQSRWLGMRVVALVGVLAACSSSGGAAAGGNGGAGGTAGGTGGTAGGTGGSTGTGGTASPSGTAGTGGSADGGRGGGATGIGGTTGSGGTGGSVGGAGGCTNIAPSAPPFGCKPTYAEQIAVLCAQGNFPSQDNRVFQCGSLRKTSTSTPNYGIACTYDDAGVLLWADRCEDVPTWCGQRCIMSPGSVVLECYLPLLDECASDAGRD